METTATATPMGPAPAAADLARVRPAASAAIIANVGIVLTGGIVRVTGSGLGCDQWPTCDGTSVVPVADADAGWHAFIEFGNRLLTFVVLATAVWVVLAARKHVADRADVRRLALLQPIGVVGQAVLGGITVLTDLNPLIVAAHFLLSMLLIAAAVVLHDRVSHAAPTQGAADPNPADPNTHGAPPGSLRWLAPVLVAVGMVVLVLGTLVTAAGPHAGDPGTPRLGLNIRTIAFAHADMVWLLVGLTVATLVVAQATSSTRVRNAAIVLLTVEVAQGGIGYLQYWLGVPATLVSLHLLGAALVWVAVLRAALALRAPAASIAAAHEP